MTRFEEMEPVEYSRDRKKAAKAKFGSKPVRDKEPHRKQGHFKPPVTKEKRA